MSFQKPPLGAAVDWSHPLARGLEALWLMNEATGDLVFDVTRHGHNGTRNGMVQDDWSTTPLGPAADFDANTKFVEIPTAVRLAVTSELTLFVLVRMNGNPGASWGRILHKANGATSDDYAFVQRADNNRVQFRIRTGTMRTIDSPTAMTVGNFYTLVGSWTQTGGGMNLYQIDENGVVVEASGTATGALNDAGENLSLGRHLASTIRNFNGEILVAGIARRKWTLDDALLLATEPYAMIAELEPQRVFFIPVAGGDVFLDGTAAAVSSLAGVLPVDKKLGATVAASSTLAGALPVKKKFASTIAAVSSLSGALPVDKGLAATIPATSALSGALALEWALAGIVPAVSTLAGEITIAGEKLLAGVIAAISTLAGELPVDKPIAGVVAATSTLDAILGKYRAITGSIDAVSTLAGDLQRLRALAGQVAGGSTLAGVLELQWALRGVIAGISTLPGSIEVERELTALVAASASLTGVLTVTSNVVEAQEGFSMPGRPQGFDFVRPQGFDTRKRKPGFDT